MNKIFYSAIILSSFIWSSVAFAQDQDISFSRFNNLSSSERSRLEMAIETGQLNQPRQFPERNINLDGINYGSQEKIALFLRLIIMDTCPSCSTTTSGSTIRVKYGGSSGGGKDAFAVDYSDNYDAEKVEQHCGKLLDRYKYDRDGKDILIIENNDDSKKIAICYNRN